MKRRAPVIMALLLASGRLCAADEIPVPQTFQNMPAADSRDASGRPWFENIPDTQLKGIIVKILAYNVTLNRMVATLNRLAAERGILEASRFPRVDAGVSGGILGGNNGRDAYISGSVPVSYELDIRGKLRAERDAALYDLKATDDERKALTIGIIAEAVELYYAGLYYKEQAALLDRLIDTSDALRKVRVNQFKKGLISQEAVLVVEGRLRELESVRRLTQSELARRERALKAMCGEYPYDGWLAGTFAVPDYFAAIPVGMPSALVRDRPDIRAAQRRLDAAGYRIKAAQKDFFPRISLTAVGQKSSQDLQELVNGESVFWNAFAVVTLPLFDGGQRKSEAQSRQAQRDQVSEDYRGALLQAFTEVEDALNKGARQAEVVGALAQKVDAVEGIRKHHEARYEQGVDSLPQVYEAAIDALESVSDLRKAELQLINYRIQLLRSLGGEWGKD